MSDLAQSEAISVFSFEDIELGMHASMENTVTESDIRSFAAITGDRNPVHLDESFAANTPFKGRIGHGMLTAGYISAVFGMRLPGPGSIYISQTLNFLRPVRIDDCITTTVKVAELISEKRRVLFECVCVNGEGKAVLQGEATLMVPERTTS